MNKIKSYLFGIFVLTLLAMGVWLLILFNFNPYQADLLTVITFFVSLFLWLTGIFILIGFYIKVQISNNEIIYSFISSTIRQSIILALAIVGILVLRTLRVLTWWDGILLALAVLLLELFFRTKYSVNLKNVKKSEE